MEGHPATVSGCKQCHGSLLKLSKHFTDGTDNLDMEEVSAEAMKNLQAKGLEPRMNKDELSAEMVRLVNEAWAPHKDKDLKAETAGIKIDKDTWPNSGMGRINADGSMGSCNACHSRHTFSKALARQPDNCGKCHMGPDHPQIEIYNESKHGIAFRNRLSQINLDPEWVVGKDYSAAPTCATCHMSRTKTQPVTHDVGLRISYTLRPVISKLTTSHSSIEDEFGEVKKITLTGPEKCQERLWCLGPHPGRYQRSSRCGLFRGTGQDSRQEKYRCCRSAWIRHRKSFGRGSQRSSQGSFEAERGGTAGLLREG